MELEELRLKILTADDGLTVADLVDIEQLGPVPDPIVEAFAKLKIVWGSNRHWGHEAFLGRENQITLGHKRGHHIAAHPEWHDDEYSPDEATEIMRKELEGTLLHELGHSVLNIAIAEDEDVLRALDEAIEQDGPVTEYFGQTERDAKHEQFAEAFRWWITGGELFEAENPAWTNTINDVLDEAEGWAG